MVHPKASLLSLRIISSFSSSFLCKLVEITIGRIKGGLRKTYLRLDGRGFNFMLEESLMEGFGFGCPTPTSQTYVD